MRSVDQHTPISVQIAAVCVAAVECGCLGSTTPLAPGLSGSIGAPNHGILTGSVELPRSGPGFVRYRPTGTAYWGTPELVRAVQAVALEVTREAPYGAPLVVGDLSARSGGAIPRHSSHRTGRDVDLLWYVSTLGGASVRNPGFIRVGTDGLAVVPGTHNYLSLDVTRQWLLFRALLASGQLHVQWLFVSEVVEALITDHAKALGEPLDLVWHAESVMRQPTDSAPHDDHVHVRLACTEMQAIAGCLDGGPRWDWLPTPPALAPVDDSNVAQIGADDPWTAPLSPILAGLGRPLGDCPIPEQLRR